MRPLSHDLHRLYVQQLVNLAQKKQTLHTPIPSPRHALLRRLSVQFKRVELNIQLVATSNS